MQLMSATYESMPAADLAPPPPNVLVFTDAAAGKVGELIREEVEPEPQIAGIRLRRRMLGLSVRLHLR